MNLTDAVALSSIITTPAHLCLLCLRFGQKSCPYLCQVCADKAREAQSKAAVLLDTELGKYILHSAQAFYKRDYQRISIFLQGCRALGFQIYLWIVKADCIHTSIYSLLAVGNRL